jgi:TonB family protein
MKISEKNNSHGIKNSELEKLRPVFFKIGLFVTLCTVFFAFEYTSETFQKKTIVTEDLIDEGWKPVNTFIEEKNTDVKKEIIEKSKTVNPFSIEIVNNNAQTEPNGSFENKNDLSTDKYLVGLDEPEKLDNTPLPPLNYAEEMPYFIDCKDIALNNMERKACTELQIQTILDKELKIPADVKALGNSFTAYLSFIVDTEGNIINVHVLRSPTKSFEKAVLNAVKKFPKFVPGKQAGRKRSIIMNQPIKVKII